MASSILSPRWLLFGVLLLAGLLWLVGGQPISAAQLAQPAPAGRRGRRAEEHDRNRVPKHQLYEPQPAIVPACDFDYDQMYLKASTTARRMDEVAEARLL